MNIYYSKIKGFALTELVIAISVIVIVIGIYSQLFDTNRTKAEILHGKLAEVASGLLRMKTDMACFPKKLSGLFKTHQMDQILFVELLIPLNGKDLILL